MARPFDDHEVTGDFEVDGSRVHRFLIDVMPLTDGSGFMAMLMQPTDPDGPVGCSPDAVMCSRLAIGDTPAAAMDTLFKPYDGTITTFVPLAARTPDLGGV